MERAIAIWKFGHGYHEPGGSKQKTSIAAGVSESLMMVITEVKA